MIDLRNLGANSAPIRISMSLLARFSEEYHYAFQENWDGAGSVALTQNVLESAESLIESYGTLDHLTEITPGRDGSISFVWEDEDGKYIYLDVGPRDTIHLYYDLGPELKWEGVSVESDPRILARIENAFRSTGWRLRQMPVVRFHPTTSNRWAGRFTLC